MILDSVFSPKLVKIGMESEDKEESFEELVDLFISINPSASREKLLSALRLRESKLSTGVVSNFALPHAQTDQVKSVQGIIGISHSGIDYESLDGKPVYVIFVLLCGEEAFALHLRALKKLTAVLGVPDILSQLLALSNPEDVIRTLARAEDSLSLS